jgi:hypothetical protein
MVQVLEYVVQGGPLGQAGAERLGFRGKQWYYLTQLTTYYS